MERNTYTFINCDDGSIVPFSEIKSMIDSSENIHLHFKGNRRSVLIKKEKGRHIREEIKSRLIEF